MINVRLINILVKYVPDDQLLTSDEYLTEHCMP